MSYQVNLDLFEGPLDLLLNLVARQQVDIYDVSLAEIAEGFLAHVRKLPETDLETASDFLLTAATLLELKASGLLPDEKPTEPVEELAAYEQQKILVTRLLEYRKFKGAAASLRVRLDAEAKFHPRVAALEPRFENLLPDFLAGVDLADLATLMDLLTARDRVRLIDVPHIATIPISIEDQIDAILSRLRSAPQQSFRELTQSASDRVEIVASFLALLELHKRGYVKLSQVRTFGEIEITLERTHA